MMRAQFVIAAASAFTIFAALAAAPASAWVIPSVAPFVSERGELRKADLAAHGMAAFVVRNETGLAVMVDFTEQTADKGHRVDFSPAFSNSLSVSVGPFKVSEKKIAKDMVSDSLALFLLPPGTYAPRSLYARKEKEKQMPGRKAEGPTFTVTAGQIVDLGVITITAEQKLLSRKVWLSSDSSSAASLEAALRALPDSSLATLPIVRGHVSVSAQ